MNTIKYIIMNFDNESFQSYINAREEKKKNMDMLNAKYKDVKMPFGKYKGIRLYDIAQIHDRYYFFEGQHYLKWASDNTSMNNDLLKEAI
jgi:uncharacterized protein (DUF3820 family)